MKKKMSIIILFLYSVLLSAQKKDEEYIRIDSIVTDNVGETYALFTEFGKDVKVCDTNSQVTMMIAKHKKPIRKLPKPMKINGKTVYVLKSKSIDIGFSFKIDHDNNRMSIWLNDDKIHCFIIKPEYKFLFQNYKLSSETIEIYGSLYVSGISKNFRIFRYFKSKIVYFDFDGQ